MEKYCKIPYSMFKLKEDDLSYGDILVLSTLRSMADENQDVMINNETLCDLFQITERTVKDHLYRLRRKGYISWKIRGKKRVIQISKNDPPQAKEK